MNDFVQLENDRCAEKSENFNLLAELILFMHENISTQANCAIFENIVCCINYRKLVSILSTVKLRGIILV